MPQQDFDRVEQAIAVSPEAKEAARRKKVQERFARNQQGQRGQPGLVGPGVSTTGIGVSAAREVPGSGALGLPRTPQTREEILRQQALSNLDEGFAFGKERGQDLFGGGVDLRKATANNLEALRAQAAGGLGAPQFAQIRGNAEAGLAQQANTNLRNLRVQQGASGVRGAAAQAGALRSGQQSDIARRGVESGLAEASIGLQERGQQAFGQAVGRERFGQLSSEFGFANIRQQAFRSAQEQALAEQALAAGQGLPGGGGGGGGNQRGGIIGSAINDPNRFFIEEGGDITGFVPQLQERGMRAGITNKVKPTELIGTPLPNKLG